MNWNDIISDPSFQSQPPEAKMKVAEGYINNFWAKDPSFMSQTPEVQDQAISKLIDTVRPQADMRTTGQKIAGAVAPYARPILETGGMIGGGLLGAGVGAMGGLATGPGALVASPTLAAVKGVAGGALGYAAGKNVADTLEEYAGTKNTETLPEKMMTTGEDIATGAAMEVGGQVIGKTLSTVAAPFARRMTNKAKTALDLANKNKIPVTAAEITGSRTESLGESVLGFTPGSAGIMQDQKFAQMKGLLKRRDEILDTISGGKQTTVNVENISSKIKDTLTSLVQKRGAKTQEQVKAMADDILKKMGSSETYESLGLKTQDIITARSKSLNEGFNKAYQSISEMIPKDMQYPSSNVQDTAARLLKQEMSKPSELQNSVPLLKKLVGMTDDIQEIVNSLPESGRKQLLEQVKPSYTWDGLHNIKTELNSRIADNDAAMKLATGGMKFMSSPEAGIYKQLAKAVDADMKAFAESASPGAKELLDSVNKVYGQTRNLMNRPAIQRILRSNPEKVLDAVIRPNNTTDVKLLKKAIGESGFAPLKEKFVSKIFDKASSSDNFWGSAQKEFGKYGDEMLAEVFKPHELKLLNDAFQKGIAKESIPTSNPFIAKVLRQSSPDTIMRMVFTPENSKNIRVAKAILPNDLWNQARTKFTEELLNVNQYGLYTPIRSARDFSKFDTQTLSQIYKPGELKALKEFMTISKVAQGAERIAGNPSGTAQSVITFEAGRALIKNPTTGWLYWLTPGALAKLYLSDTGRKYLTTGFKVATGAKSKAEIASKILAIAGADAIKEEERVE